MPKAIADIKTASNEIAKRAKLGQYDERGLITVGNDLVNYLAAKEAPAQPQAVVPAPAARPVAVPAATPTDTEAADGGKKPRGLKRVTVCNQAPVVPAVTVGTPAPEPVK